jgi:hypothetical protein
MRKNTQKEGDRAVETFLCGPGDQSRHGEIDHVVWSTNYLHQALFLQDSNWLDTLHNHGDRAAMDARDIERYLTELGAALKNGGMKQPLRMMVISESYQGVSQSLYRRV